MLQNLIESKVSSYALFEIEPSGRRQIFDIHEMICRHEEVHASVNDWKLRRIMVIDDEEFCIAAMKAMLGLVGIHQTY